MWVHKIKNPEIVGSIRWLTQYPQAAFCCLCFPSGLPAGHSSRHMISGWLGRGEGIFPGRPLSWASVLQNQLGSHAHLSTSPGVRRTELVELEPASPATAGSHSAPCLTHIFCLRGRDEYPGKLGALIEK